MVKIAVIDYDSGNVRSVCKAVDFLGHESVLTNNISDILSSDGVILPGVGAFGDCVEKLKKYDVWDVVFKFVEDKKPFLGICVGHQLLFKRSFEFGEYEGFGFVEGEVRKFPRKEGFKVPHMGWNNVIFDKKNKLFNDIDSGSFFYFVHSYYGVALDSSQIAHADYIVNFTAAVNKENIWGVQFHPEKSQRVGLKVLENFCKICEGKL